MLADLGRRERFDLQPPKAVAHRKLEVVAKVDHVLLLEEGEPLLVRQSPLPNKETERVARGSEAGYTIGAVQRRGTQSARFRGGVRNR